jgi:hypothetical protein
VVQWVERLLCKREPQFHQKKKKKHKTKNPETLKILQENMEETLQDIDLGKSFLSRTPITVRIDK